MPTESSDEREARPPAPARPAPSPAGGMQDMTQGSVRGHVVRMMLFVLTGLVFQTLYALVDLFWVGRLGKEAVAAVSLSSNLMFVALAVTQMLSVGCVALVSQAAGRKEHAEVQRLFNQAQSLSTTAGVIFLVLGLSLRHLYAQRLGGDAVTVALAERFLVYFLPALALQFTMVGLGSALRGIGDMRPGLIAQTLSVLLNMVLAPFLVFGWGTGHPLGVAGASLASLLSTGAAVLGLVAYLARGGTYLKVRFADWRPDPRVWKRMMSIGMPAGAEFLLMSIIIGVVYVVSRPFGPPAQAGFGIASRIIQAGFMPAVAISFASAAVVGQNYGARAFGRVREVLRESARLTVAFMVAFVLVSHAGPAALIGLFSKEPAVIDAGSDYLRTVSYNYVASGLIFVFGGLFQGMGNTWPSLLASACRASVFVVPVLWLSNRAGFELHTVWLFSVATVTLQCVVSGLLLRRELRLRMPLQPATPAGPESAS